MLRQLAHPMSVPFPTRRTAQAAALTLSLIGCRPTDGEMASAGVAYVSVPLPGFMLWATRCDPPLLIEEAMATAMESGRDVLILRVGTGSPGRPPVAFDWVRHMAERPTPRLGFLAALPAGGGLILVAEKDSEPHLEIRSVGILERSEHSPGWPLERLLAVARATAIYRSNLWGGL